MSLSAGKGTAVGPARCVKLSNAGLRPPTRLDRSFSSLGSMVVIGLNLLRGRRHSRAQALFSCAAVSTRTPRQISKDRQPE